MTWLKAAGISAAIMLIAIAAATLIILIGHGMQMLGPIVIGVIVTAGFFVGLTCLVKDAW